MGRLLLAGAFGQANPGDEALLTSFLEHLDGWDVVATTRNPHATRARHGCATVDPAQPWAVLRTVLHVDAVVVAGGTIFKRLPAETGRRPLALLVGTAVLATVARVRGVPFALVGVGAGDLATPTARLLARLIVRSSNMVILRDEESAAVLAAAGVPTPFRVGADAAWGLWSERAAPRAAARAEAPIVVAVSRHAANGQAECERLAVAIAGGLSRFVSAGVPIHVQPWQVEDIAMARAVLVALPSRSARFVPPPTTLRDASAEYAMARAVVGLRFHALVAAAAAGTPFVAYEHEPKLAALARRFEHPADRGVPALDALAGAIDAAMAVPPARPVARAEAIRAEEMFRLLHLLLNGGDDNDLATLAGLTLADGVPR